MASVFYRASRLGADPVFLETTVITVPLGHRVLKMYLFVLQICVFSEFVAFVCLLLFDVTILTLIFIKPQ